MLLREAITVEGLREHPEALPEIAGDTGGTRAPGAAGWAGLPWGIRCPERWPGRSGKWRRFGGRGCTIGATSDATLWSGGNEAFRAARGGAHGQQ